MVSEGLVSRSESVEAGWELARAGPPPLGSLSLGSGGGGGGSLIKIGVAGWSLLWWKVSGPYLCVNGIGMGGFFNFSLCEPVFEPVVFGGRWGSSWGCGPGELGAGGGPRYLHAAGVHCISGDGGAGGPKGPGGVEAHCGLVAQMDLFVDAALDVGKVPEVGRHDMLRRVDSFVAGSGMEEEDADALPRFSDSGGGAPGGSILPCRFSQRLATAANTPVLDKAIARKARLQDTGGNGGGRRTRSALKIQQKSSKCGVLLTEWEANSLKDFASPLF